uniref:cellulose 1,4-beta-cellobiosidase (non-reducing end) n=1 Tax=uncultured symbiotic protist of Reticulitermes speratus TaxID=403658 RepID=A4UWQ0_9EUKA|nr:putative glycosyl hydrolase family7 [uncultured symbiotic protist of Reticulitermes speratus]
MFALVVLAIQLLTAQGNEAFTYSLNGAQQTGAITIDQEWRGNTTPKADVKLSNFGVTVSGGSVSQKFKTGTAVGSRIYILAPGGTAYEKFKLVGNVELTFDVDISQIPCGMNAAIYTAEMPADGVTPGHESGAAYGGGYCDANYVGGVGCAEFDIGESNARATVYTSHGCSPTTGFAKQGSISCDTGGTGANPYRQDKNFYGNGSSFTVNTAQKFTVVTQFKGSPVTTIDRIYVQGGKQSKQPNNINNNLDRISPSFSAGHVLIFSLWASDGDMSWMDCNDNGPCNAGQESSRYLEQNYPNATVTYSNIKYGPLDSTY